MQGALQERELLERAIKRVEKRKRTTERALEDLRELLKLLNEKLSLEEKITGYGTGKSFPIKAWRLSRDGHYFIYEFDGMLKYVDGKIWICDEYGNEIINEDNVGDITYINFAQFIEVLREFLENVAGMKTWEEEEEKLRRVIEILKEG